MQVALRGDNSFNGLGAEAPDQFVLEIDDADVEAERLHVVALEVRTKAGALEAAPEVALLSDIAQACKPQVEPLRAEAFQESADCLRTSDRNDRHALRFEAPTPTPRERLERDLVARPLDEDNRPRTGRSFDGVVNRFVEICHESLQDLTRNGGRYPPRSRNATTAAWIRVALRVNDRGSHEENELVGDQPRVAIVSRYQSALCFGVRRCVS